MQNQCLYKNLRMNHHNKHSIITIDFGAKYKMKKMKIKCHNFNVFKP